MYLASSVYFNLGSHFPIYPEDYVSKHYMSQMLYAGQSAREDVPFLSDF